MDKRTQTGPSGTVITWAEGATITAKMQLSNMLNVQIAQAQGVKPTGYLVVTKSFEKLIALNTYLKYPKGNVFLRVADNGIVEAGDGLFQERQYAIEAIAVLPK